MSIRQIDVLKVASFFGADLPPRPVIYLGLFLVFLVPIVAIYQAFQLRRFGKTGFLFWFALILSIVVLGIYLLAATRVHRFLKKYYLRMEEAKQQAEHQQIHV